MAVQKTGRYWFQPPLAFEGLILNGMGILERMVRAVVDRPTGTGDYLFMLFYDPVDVGTGGMVRRHGPGSLIIWRPADGHYYGNPDRRFTHTWLHCDGPFVARCLRREKVPLDTVMALPNAHLFEK